MLDFFKKIQEKQFQKHDDEPQGKTKKDKVFIGIIIVFALIIVISLITGIGDINQKGSIEKLSCEFKFSVTDGIILGVIVIGYLITQIRKGRK